MIETIHLQLLLATFAGWVGYSRTIIDGRREIGGVDPIFGHYGVA
jgi:hypothetical protein